MPCSESIYDLLEESRRQEPIVVAIATADFPDIVTRPIEFVTFGNNDPGALVIKSEMTFDRCGNFNSRRRIGRRSMRNRQNHDDGHFICMAFDCQHDHARAIFAPFFPSRVMLAMPQIGIGYDKTRLGRGDRHAPSLFWFKHGIEMRMPLVHAGRSDRMSFFIRQFGRRKTAAMLLEAAEFLVLVRRNEIARDRSVARYRNRLSLGEHSIAAEVPGEFRSWDGVSHVGVLYSHANIRNLREKRNLRIYDAGANFLTD